MVAAYEREPDELVQCPKCEKFNDNDASFCDQCGFDLTSTGFEPAPYSPDADETVKCPACEKMLDDDSLFCDQCGADLSSDNPTSRTPANATDDSSTDRSTGSTDTGGTDNSTDVPKSYRGGVKDMPVKIKAGPDDNLPEGTFTAYASVFGVTDSYGDVVVKGAFEKTLAAWSESGNPIPLLFGHNLSDPDYNIGAVKSATEDDHGLLVECELDLDNPKAAQVYRLLKGKRINQMSYAYDIVDAKSAKSDDGASIQELHDLRLYEISVVTVGANPETEVLAVKHTLEGLAAATKAGRTISAANEKSLRQAADLITAVLSSIDSSANDQSTASGNATAKTRASDEDRTRGKSSVRADEPKPNPSAYAIWRTRIATH